MMKYCSMSKQSYSCWWQGQPIVESMQTWFRSGLVHFSKLIRTRTAVSNFQYCQVVDRWLHGTVQVQKECQAADLIIWKQTDGEFELNTFKSNLLLVQPGGGHVQLQVLIWLMHTFACNKLIIILSWTFRCRWNGQTRLQVLSETEERVRCF